MGRKIVLTGTKLTDLNAPKLAEIDLILPEQGALLLLDPANPVNPWPSGKPASGATLPNLAFDQANVMAPTQDDATLHATFTIGSAFLDDGVQDRIERTAKGGLHVIISRTAGSSNLNRFINLYGGNGIRNYIGANKAHAWYVAVWGRTTRAYVYGAGSNWNYFRMEDAAKIAHFYFRTQESHTIRLPQSADVIGWSHENVANPTSAAPVPFFQDQAVSTGATATTPRAEMFMVITGGATDMTTAPSTIFYGAYIEDLTVSGRTYAEVNALVRAKYERDVKTPGGRYYDDTWTDPATIP